MARKEKRKKRDDLDMETTVADMNVEGFSWYDPHRKNGKQAVYGNVYTRFVRNIYVPLPLRLAYYSH